MENNKKYIQEAEKLLDKMNKEQAILYCEQLAEKLPNINDTPPIHRLTEDKYQQYWRFGVVSAIKTITQKDESLIGGKLEIPDGYFVMIADFDHENPYIKICTEDGYTDEQVLSVPKSLAYYLKNHCTGSAKMSEKLINSGKREIINKLKNLIEL
jgi:hypothetical protein